MLQFIALWGSPNLRIAYGLVDLVSPIIVLLLLTLIAFTIYRRRKTTQPHYKYFFISFILKIFGNALTALMYGVYYGYGDTFGYFNYSNSLYTSFLENPLTLPSLFNSISRPTGTQHVYNTSFLFSLFTGNSYLSVSLLFTFLSVIGGWLVYLVFIDIYPKLKKQLAICTLFIPSIWFWGTGLQKESLMVFGIGALFFAFYKSFFKKKYVYLLLVPLGYYGIMVKSYTLYLLILFLLLWVIFYNIKKIKLSAIRFILIVGFSISLIGGTGFYFYVTGAGLDILLAESDALNEAVGTASYISRVTAEKGGSGYDLGTPDNTFIGLLSKVLPSINVTLFRPYIWEAKKVVNLPAAIESFALMLLVLVVVIKTRIFGFFSTIFNSPLLLSCFVYCLLFSFIVGFTSYNFGALVRYKLPVVMFFYALVYLVYYEYKEKKKYF